MSSPKWFLQWVLPVLIVAGGVLLMLAMISSRPEVERQVTESLPPLVRVLEVERRSVQLHVRSQGTVRPRIEIDLVAEVSGRVVGLSPNLEAGGFVAEGELLVQLDARDYAAAARRAEAEVVRAEVALERELAEAEVAREQWSSLGRGEPTRLALREPQVTEARALLAAARASLAEAEVDLERTELTAPFAGRLRSKSVDVGQFVVRGQALASLYGTDFVEVVLPVPDEDLAAIELELGPQAPGAGEAGPEVRLTATFAGAPRTWIGRLVRSEGVIDERTRRVPLVVRVPEPFGRKGSGINGDAPGGSAAGFAPLTPGLFVEAEIAGRTMPDVVVLPREALRGSGEVFVVDQAQRMWRRPVEVLRAERDQVYVSGGLEDGERVCLSPVSALTDGMSVRVAEPEDAR